ncbi:MAG: carbohydrate ABC transporter permease [Acholeplasmatales bacterium]|nr:carbohydrate ABC transporter permease [Acholeplasmatales bacterium]
MESTLLEKDEASLELDVNKERKRQKTLKIVKNILVYSFLTICALLAFLPFYWMIISSLKGEPEYRESVPTFFPRVFKWENYSYVLNYQSSVFGQVLFNTILIGVVSTVLGLIVIVLTAYAFARIEFKGKGLLFSLMLATMMIPGELYTITNFVTVSNLGWRDTYIVMILPFLVSIYYIYLLRNAFKQIPESLYKAAKVDGCGNLSFLIKVMVPLTAPTLISITLLKFIGTWNSYIWPRLVNVADGYDYKLISNWMTVGFSDPDGVLGTVYTEANMTTLKMCAACLVSSPLFVLFLFFRKYIMHGVSKSGTKG